MKFFLRVSVAVVIAVSTACSNSNEYAAAPEQTDASALVAKEAAREFDAAVEALSLAYFRELPEIATYYGAPADLAPNASGRLNDRSPVAEIARRALVEGHLSRLTAIDAEGLDEQRRITRDSIVNILDGAMAPARVVGYGGVLGEYGVWFSTYVIGHDAGPLIAIPSLLEAQHTVKSRADAESYIARLEAFGPVLDDALEKARADEELGVIPPDFIIERTQSIIGGFVGVPIEQNMLHASFDRKLRDARIEGADELRLRARAVIEEVVYPAYDRIGLYLESIRPTAPHDAGVWRLPNGDAFYRALIRHMTDTELTPQEIHEIGLREVDRIVGEMDVILRREGYAEGTVAERMIALGEDPRFRYPNTDEGKAALLADIEKQIEGVSAVLPLWFGVAPKYQVEVRAVPKFSEETASGGYYDAPALDGSRPGVYWINLRDTAVWPTFTVPTLTYHEAVPGHHLQTAIALEQVGPLMGNVLFSNASGEGWGLYAEYLAAEMGLYADDPYGDLGRLGDELHRAIRLVVDTGMHAMKWSREDAIKYMRETEGNEPSEVVSEIERYAAWPGQALGYKIGMLKILELRRDAEAAFGESFDVREFHDRILRISSAPLPVIEKEMRAWVATAAGSAPPAARQ